MTATYDFWLRALAITGGERALTREEMQALGLTHEAGLGFFQTRMHYTRLIKDDTLAPAAIWEDEGALVAISRNPSPLVAVNAETLWLGACRFPLSEARYRALTNGSTT
jgi:hypothetical protein